MHNHSPLQRLLGLPLFYARLLIPGLRYLIQTGRSTDMWIMAGLTHVHPNSRSRGFLPTKTSMSAERGRETQAKPAIMGSAPYYGASTTGYRFCLVESGCDVAAQTQPPRTPNMSLI
ncbi:hypothetical protein K445DRAFT_317265 [Daldinia sp. EC12]|nr:hypothetical protein K445DRAFT_317265 [Daldinia sp. EC12]